MKYLGLLSCFVGIVIHSFALNYCYKQVTSTKAIKKNPFYYLCILLLSLIIFAINMFVDYKFRIFFFYLILALFYKVLYKESTFITLFKTLMIYIILVICDFLISLIIMLIPGITTINLEYINYVKDFSTLLDSICLFLVFRIKYLTSVLNKLFAIVSERRKHIYTVLSFLSFVALYTFAYYNAFNKTFNSYIFSLIISVFFLCLLAVALVQYYKKKQKENEQKQLLDLMKEYEELLDVNRDNRHEMFNNLLILKTTKDKTSKEFEELIDSYLDKYSTKTVNNYSSLYNLPTGIKGIVYYKMAYIKENEIVFRSFTDKSMYQKFDTLDPKLYYKVCKILGILLDNAIEASTETKEKHLMMDVYDDYEYLIVYIENTFKGKIDINEINNRGVSSKGKGRGLGLDIVGKILKSTEALSLEQRIDGNRFISTLKIKL